MSSTRRWLEQVILFVAVVFGTLNVVGGFVVTDRMLGMFKGKKPAAAGCRRGNEWASAMNYLVYGALHRRVRDVHLRPDGADRSQDRGARQLDRRRGHGPRSCARP